MRELRYGYSFAYQNLRSVGGASRKIVRGRRPDINQDPTEAHRHIRRETQPRMMRSQKRIRWVESLLELKE